MSDARSQWVRVDGERIYRYFFNYPLGEFRELILMGQGWTKVENPEPHPSVVRVQTAASWE